MSQKPIHELQQSFKGAAATGTTKSPSPAKKRRGYVRFAPRPERATYNTRRSWKLSPAKVRLEISEAGTASVVDGRRGRRIGSQPEKESSRFSGVTYLKCSSRVGLAQKLRRLASSLEKEPGHSLKALLMEIEDFVGEVRSCVQKAEQTALTSGFYGQPPRIKIE